MKLLFPTLLALSLALSACGKADTTTTPAHSAASAIQLSSIAGNINLPAAVNNIAVLDYTSLDTLNTLGAAAKVLGIPQASVVPAELVDFASPSYRDFGAVNNVNLEQLAAAAPELIISADRLQKQNAQFQAIAPTYHYHIDLDHYWASFQQQTLNLAKIVGQTAAAEQELARLDQQAATVAAKAHGKTALIVMVNNDKLMAFGAHSRFGLIHDKLGFTPIDEHIKVGTHGQSISYEYIAEKNPDYLFVIDRATAVTGKTGTAEAALNNDIIKQTRAFKNQHIVYLNAADWYLMNGGLGAMSKMLAEVEQAI